MEKRLTLPELETITGWNYDTLSQWANEGILKVRTRNTKKGSTRRSTVSWVEAAEEEVERRKAVKRTPPDFSKVQKPLGKKQTSIEYLRSRGLIS